MNKSKNDKVQMMASNQTSDYQGKLIDIKPPNITQFPKEFNHAKINKSEMENIDMNMGKQARNGKGGDSERNSNPQDK